MDRPPVLTWSEAVIEQTARERLAGEPLAAILLKQAATEARLKWLRNVRFRVNRNADAVAAYQKMKAREFEDLNARQKWANWRTIPRNLNGLLTARPLTAIDLCCGVGHSTAALAAYLPEGSSVLGLEVTPEFVETARARAFFHRSGAPADVTFRMQSVLENFRDAEGHLIADESIDVVNSSGAVGHHFDTKTTRVLACEVDRVLKPGGLALMDSGSAGTSLSALLQIFGESGYTPIHRAKSCWIDPLVQVAFRKNS